MQGHKKKRREIKPFRVTDHRVDSTPKGKGCPRGPCFRGDSVCGFYQTPLCLKNKGRTIRSVERERGRELFGLRLMVVNEQQPLATNTLRQAQAFNSLGCSMIPLEFKQKTPLVKWGKYQSEKPTDAELNEWFGGEPRNLGVVCGAVSGNLIVQDFDDPEKYVLFYPNHAELEKQTIVVKTAKGIQVYLRSMKGMQTTKIPELKLDIRGEGSYVVAPPSIHPDGPSYQFIGVSNRILEVADFEESFWKRVEELGVRKRVFTDPTWRVGRVGNYKGPHPPCIVALLEGVEKGSRHDSAMRLYSYFINFRGEKPKRVHEKILKWDAEKNKPSLKDEGKQEELEDIYSDVTKGPYNYGCTDTMFRCFCTQHKCEIGKNKISAEAIAKAQELMKDPMAFLQFLQQCLEYRLTGEHKNRLFMFLAGCGASVKTILVRLCGPNSVGKNMLCSWMQEVFGSDRVLVFSSATAAWLKRKVMTGLDTRGKIFILLEERGEGPKGHSRLKYQFEQIYSEDRIVLGLNTRNEESGEWEPVEVVLQGPLCFITTSTELEFSLHAKTREWEIHPDDSLKQTEQIDNWYNWRELIPVEALEEERQQLEVLKAYIGLLKVHKDHRVPFVNKINFKVRTLEDRRRKGDFIALMKYASHVFQGVLPTDEKTDIVFAIPFIYDFVLTIADDIIYTARGGLTKSEEKVQQFIEQHPEIYHVTTEGRPPRPEIKDSSGQVRVPGEPAVGFLKRGLMEHKDFRIAVEGMHENTLKNALTGLVRKGRLALLREAKRGGTNVYGKPLSTTSIDEKQAYLPEIAEISTGFLTGQVDKILYGISGHGKPENLDVLKSLIETCPVVHLKITPEMILFQPKWPRFELFGVVDKVLLWLCRGSGLRR